MKVTINNGQKTVVAKNIDGIKAFFNAFGDVRQWTVTANDGTEWGSSGINAMPTFWEIFGN